ncbi:MAG: WYL domain-containing protein [Actinomycetota bacterium]|nr:WYL domain-containing protein [Actinomycetota bacterium]
MPYVVSNPGTPVQDLSKLFDVSEADLLDDLNLLFLTGLPPYGPGDLIEVDIDDERRVWIRMADYFSRPVRLTREEGLALYLRMHEILGTGGLEEAAALRAALAKLADALGAEALEQAVEVAEGGSGGPLGAVRAAAAGHKRIEIEYYSATGDELTTRAIDPEQVFSALGNWYVAAWDHGADAERLFRVDRIREVREMGETFEPRGLAGAGRDLYTGSEEDVEVRLRLGPGVRWVAEYYVVSESRDSDGSLEVTLPTKSLAWVPKLVLRLGGAARVLGPDELRTATRELAHEALTRYR